MASKFASNLRHLNGNNKPAIDGLTKLAGENVEHAQVIHDAIEKHLTMVRKHFLYICFISYYSPILNFVFVSLYLLIFVFNYNLEENH